MAREEKTIVVVHCAMLDEELPALAKPPFPGPLGERIYDEISQYGYQMWNEQATLLINHYGLNMADPRAQEFINAQLEEFFFGEGAQLPDDWVAEGQGGNGGPPAKGAPAPPRK